MTKKTTVATAQESKTTTKIEKKNITPNGVTVTKTPTGKIITLEEKKKRREEREKQYYSFRINALKRRAKRMKLSDEDTEKAVEKLKKQMAEPRMYDIVIMFNTANADMVKQALLNNNISYSICVATYAFVKGTQEVLNKLREILPEIANIYPYAKKPNPVLPVKEPPKIKKPHNKAERKKLAIAAKKKRKADKIQAHIDRKEHARQQKEVRNKKARKAAKQKMLFEKRCQKRQKAKALVVAHNTKKKASNASKKASTGLKQAA